MGDDDTIFFTDNLVKVLAKYDHEQMWYIGGNSESVEQDVMHAYDMAFGGGGFAISRPLAARLAGAMDGCLQRYFYFYGSDQRIAACVSEIGVPFTEERGFHQVSSVRARVSFSNGCSDMCQNFFLSRLLDPDTFNRFRFRQKLFKSSLNTWTFLIKGIKRINHLG